MAVKKVALANRWVSVTDVLDRLRRARENREQQTKLLEGLEGRVKQRRDDVERSLADLSPSQRSEIVSRAVNGYRAELKRQSLDGRVAYLGGRPEHYDRKTEAMMEWHLRSLGYERQEYRPMCWAPVKVAWFRRRRWPEDGPWIRGDLVAILDEVESVCD